MVSENIKAKSQMVISNVDFLIFEEVKDIKTIGKIDLSVSTLKIEK
jgi:hypothetical protein